MNKKFNWRKWKKAGWKHKKRAYIWWISGWRDPKKALRFCKAGWHFPGVALEWEEYIDSDFTEEIASEWYEHGWSDPEIAKLWFTNGFSVDEADKWKEKRFSLIEACDWRKEGYTPEEAQQWDSLSLTPEHLKKWLKYGFEFDEIQYYRGFKLDLKEAYIIKRLKKDYDEQFFKVDLTEEEKIISFLPKFARKSLLNIFDKAKEHKIGKEFRIVQEIDGETWFSISFYRMIQPILEIGIFKKHLKLKRCPKKRRVRLVIAYPSTVIVSNFGLLSYTEKIFPILIFFCSQDNYESWKKIGDLISDMNINENTSQKQLEDLAQTFIKKSMDLLIRA